MDSGHRAVNEYLAAVLRRVHAEREASWVPGGGQSIATASGHYTRTYRDCYPDAGIGPDNPLGLILDCLFTAGFCEIWEFCEQAEGRTPT